MTNAGDFDGKTTHGSREAGGDGEYLLRVGSRTGITCWATYRFWATTVRSLLP